jgi:hypothetical protein
MGSTRENQPMMTTFEKGVANGMRPMVRALLESRFGPLSEAASNQLNCCATERLEALAISLMNAKSLQELGLEG